MRGGGGAFQDHSLQPRWDPSCCVLRHQPLPVRDPQSLPPLAAPQQCPHVPKSLSQNRNKNPKHSLDCKDALSGTAWILAGNEHFPENRGHPTVPLNQVPGDIEEVAVNSVRARRRHVSETRSKVTREETLGL